MPSFQKSLIVEQFQGNYLKLHIITDVRNTLNYHVVIALGLFEISSTITLSLAVFFFFFRFWPYGRLWAI